MLEIDRRVIGVGVVGLATARDGCPIGGMAGALAFAGREVPHRRGCPCCRHTDLGA
ncbi:hypothetical protein CHELA1G11_20568 [Hyphomicrobiales bacterium]|nr:hypothetical protein CHELA1G11_20568 [Hyphomicrobiales bacterium]CAH1690845.1 hypothetical protein CHELA1G2_20884 [Hyphomicrobiales bacterium]